MGTLAHEAETCAKYDGIELHRPSLLQLDTILNDFLDAFPLYVHVGPVQRCQIPSIKDETLTSNRCETDFSLGIAFP